jgi:hypothetical protein
MPEPGEQEAPTPAGPRPALWTAVAVAVVVGCLAAGVVIGRSGGDAPAGPRATASAAAGTERPPAAQQVTLAHAWPDGVTATIVAVTRAGADLLPYGPESPANDAGVIVTTDITNTGSTVLRWDTSTAVPGGTLLYGKKRLPARMHGWNGGTPLPPRLLPGASARWSVIGFLPGAQVRGLAYSMTPRSNDPAHSAWTFTAVDRLIGG